MKFIEFLFVLFSAYAVNTQEICPLKVDTMDKFETQLSVLELNWSFYSSGILKSHSGFYKSDTNKTVILSAPKGYSIFAAVRLVDLRPHNEDYLTIFANETSGPVTYSNSYSYRNRKFDIFESEKTFYAPDGQLGVNFYTGPSVSTWGCEGFEILYTVQANWTKCSSKDFHCLNRRCIPHCLKCDGHNHCGDRSEQNNCISPNPLSPKSGRTAGIVGGVVFFLIAVACSIYIIIRRVKLKKGERRTIINPYSSARSISSYPPPYDESGVVYPPPPPPYSPYNQGVVNPGYQ